MSEKAISNNVNADSVSNNIEVNSVVSQSASSSANSSSVSSASSISSASSASSSTSNSASSDNNTGSSASSSTTSSATSNSDTASSTSNSTTISEASSSTDSSNVSSSFATLMNTDSYTIDDRIGSDQNNTSFQKIVYLRSSKVDGNGNPIKNPYVVSGNDGDIISLPNGEQVKISGNQLVDPNTNESFNNNDYFDNGNNFDPVNKDYTVSFKLRFEDLSGNPQPNKYNNNNPDGELTITQNVYGYDGEPFDIDYRNFLGDPSLYKDYVAQTINNQVNNQQPYLVAILGHGLMNGNDTVILKPTVNYAKINYYYYDNMRQRHDIPSNELYKGIYADSIDINTPFNNLEASKYFSVVPGQSESYNDYEDPNNPQIINVQVTPKPITQNLRVKIMKKGDTNPNDAVYGTVTFQGLYGNKSTVNINPSNITVDGSDNPLSNPNNNFLSSGTNLSATLGVDPSGNLGENNFTWDSQDNVSSPLLTWDNPGTDQATPVVYYVPSSSSNTPASGEQYVTVPKLLYTYRLWGPYDQSYNPDPATNLAHDPYTIKDYNKVSGKNNGIGAVNFSTVFNSSISTADKLPKNSIIQLVPWTQSGYSGDNRSNPDVPIVVQVDKDNHIVRLKCSW
ncbi:hypothetical protein [Nicoliella lavandulae]|uniref:Uncharacterized protein n=1 Tax=Nicoliella lavandulae TaxID=3082954 RepID=A0ABU8SK88_9LACO